MNIQLHNVMVIAIPVEGEKTTAVIDADGTLTQWRGSDADREAIKPVLEAIWVALASDGFFVKPQKETGA